MIVLGTGQGVFVQHQQLGGGSRFAALLAMDVYNVHTRQFSVHTLFDSILLVIISY